MKNLFLLGAILLCLVANSQTTPRFQKYEIASGCKAYFPTPITAVDSSKSEDSSDVYTVEEEFNDYFYSVIVIKLNEEVESDSQEDLLIGYLDFLKGNFGITNSAGYGKGHTHPVNSNAKGVIDYWTDKDGVEWSIKGWVDSKYIAVMMLYGAEEFPNSNVVQVFLNGFRFPE